MINVFFVISVNETGGFCPPSRIKKKKKKNASNWIGKLATLLCNENNRKIENLKHKIIDCIANKYEIFLFFFFEKSTKQKIEKKILPLK